MSSAADRAHLIVRAQKYSEQEIHAINKWCSFLSDSDDENIKAKVETMLQAFVNRKLLGIPVTIKAIEQEFIPEANEPAP